jgi:hypothetical protein
MAEILVLDLCELSPALIGGHFHCAAMDRIRRRWRFAIAGCVMRAGLVFLPANNKENNQSWVAEARRIGR